MVEPLPEHAESPTGSPASQDVQVSADPTLDVPPLLDIENLRVSYPRQGFRARPVEILHGVSLNIRPGETVGLVGESGSGKTTIGRAVLGLAPITGGTITFDGEHLESLGRRRRRELGKDLQVVFQDPYTSLNPARTIGDTLAEPLYAQGMSRKAAMQRVRALLDRVSLPAGALARFPAEFSGGQRQRVAIARALTVQPRLIVCDEPVSALDLTTQAKVLELLLEIQRDTGVSYLFISHDLSVIRFISNRVSVISGGEIVESGSTAEITEHPSNPYTRRLLLSAPVADPARQRRRRAQLDEFIAEQEGAA